ncbi:MAG: phosphoribosylformylglycinamidine cyclo-ligase, partial [bacterium]|nr:phosphoribosylformylglycinamidine cyclo-ligase [Candidatus Kapabacteria bacterium]
YQKGEFDLAGMVVGVVERMHMVTGQNSAVGDVLIGLPSTGLHTNGYSLARAALFPKYGINDNVIGASTTIADALLAVHRSYLGAIQETMGIDGVHAYSHITGGGIEGNTRRVVRDPLTLRINWDAWQRPPIYNMIQSAGDVPEEAMREAFNLGIGLVIAASPAAAPKIVERLKAIGEEPVIVGGVE